MRTDEIGEGSPGDDEQQGQDANVWCEANWGDVYVEVPADEPVVRTLDLGRGVRIDFDEHDGVVGVELVDCERVTVNGVEVPVGRDPSTWTVDPDGLIGRLRNAAREHARANGWIK